MASSSLSGLWVARRVVVDDRAAFTRIKIAGHPEYAVLANRQSSFRCQADPSPPVWSPSCDWCHEQPRMLDFDGAVLTRCSHCKVRPRRPEEAEAWMCHPDG